jgi:hypothetical protein
MKNQLNVNLIFLVVFSIFSFNATIGFAQKTKKNKVRIKAQVVTITDGEVYFDIKASSKIKRRNMPLIDKQLTIYNVFNNEKVSLGKIKTNTSGAYKFRLKNIDLLTADSTTNKYNIVFAFKGDTAFKKASKSISFKSARINAKLITKDSINFIKATLLDVNSGNSIPNELLKVQVQRLFKPLTISKELTYTDENGTIIVPIEKGIPGVNGNLTFETVLEANDEYGTVKTLVSAPIGKPIVDESTFDQRTLWSPRNKTPLFILIFPNLLIFGIWGLIIYLITNLFKITKS